MDKIETAAALLAAASRAGGPSEQDWFTLLELFRVDEELALETGGEMCNLAARPAPELPGISRDMPGTVGSSYPAGGCQGDAPGRQAPVPQDRERNVAWPISSD